MAVQRIYYYRTLEARCDWIVGAAYTKLVRFQNDASSGFFGCLPTNSLDLNCLLEYAANAYLDDECTLRD
jgi:hypothetical protein